MMIIIFKTLNTHIPDDAGSLIEPEEGSICI